jgi:predicted kinase
VDAVVLTGIQGSGKTTFFADRFLATHVRISRDLLRTPHREARFVDLCLETRQRFVVDKVNATREDRRPYVERAREAGFAVTACWLDVAPRDAIARNARRAAEWQVPVPAILGTRKRLQPPALDEGFDAVWRVWPAADGGFVVDLVAGAAPGDAGPGDPAPPPRWTRRVPAAR